LPQWLHLIADGPDGKYGGTSFVNLSLVSITEKSFLAKQAPPYR
jgi:hypothetical protein